MSKLGFSLDDVEVAVDAFAPVDAGTYAVKIDEVKALESSKKGNYYLDFKMSIIEGKFKNKKFFPKVNFVNSNPDAQRIGREQLKAICVAVGSDTSNPDTDDFLGKTLQVRVTKEMDDYRGEMANKVKSFSALENSTVPTGEKLEETRKGWM